MQNESDFPAAHSMDTVWFAIDKEGFIAQFWSDEAGAVPEEAVTKNDRLKPTKLACSSEVIYDLNGYKELCFGTNIHRSTDHKEYEKRAILFLSEESWAQRLVEKKIGKRVQSTKGYAVICESLSEEIAQSIHSEKACFGCFDCSTNSDSDKAASKGFFVYEHSCANGLPEPYIRTALPSNPLIVTNLPNKNVEALKQACFDGLRFTETQQIQPLEHMPCFAWAAEHVYLGTDGNTHPMPEGSGLDD